MRHSTVPHAAAKPEKPRSDFPLFAHATRRWAKKVKGKIHYFGPWDDPDGALQKWLDQKDYLLTGRKPPTDQAGLTLGALCNRFLSSKTDAVEIGQLSPRTLRSYYRTCQSVIAAFGNGRMVSDLRPDDFGSLRKTLAKRLSLYSLKIEMQRVRVLFKYAYDAELIDKPLRFGPDFKSPPKKDIKRVQRQNGSRMFEAAEIRTMIDAAGVHLKAMILLGINAGYGNNDCASLTFDALDLDGGWVEHPRPKTGEERRCPLWPETIEALRASLAKRRAPKDPRNNRLVFITPHGNEWVRHQKKRGSDQWEHGFVVDSINRAMRGLMIGCKIKRVGRSFYGLRHAFETAAGECLDQIAVNSIMGHVDSSMAANYRHGISDERLQAVVDHVHAWLFGREGGAQ